MFGMPISGLLCEWFGWESVFYVFGEFFPLYCLTAYVFYGVGFVIVLFATDISQ